RKAKFGKKTVDLYAAFEAIALDESAFRAQLGLYAEWKDGKPRVLPSQIPPFVTQHLPWLKPTAANKMFNAVLVEEAHFEFKPTGYPNTLSQLKENLDLWRPILAQVNSEVELPSGSSAFDALIGV